MITHSTPSLIILIDDDAANNMISKVFIKKALPDATFISFTDPVKGVAYIRDEYAASSVPAMLMLDINMPTLSGWDVMELINKMPASGTDNLTTYIVSSSIDPMDKNMALTTPRVAGYIEKPFNIDKVNSIFFAEMAVTGS